jgi:hypothetical protein
LALLLPQEERAQRGAFAAEMLVRALKMLDYFLKETIGMVIATAALDQPGDEGWAYGRARLDWQPAEQRPARRSDGPFACLPAKLINA